MKNYQICDDDEDEEQPLTIDESIAEDEQPQDHLRISNNFTNSLQLTAASLLGLANGNGYVYFVNNVSDLDQ